MGIFSRLFGNKQKPAPSSSTEPHIVVADFGEVLATRAPVPGTVADVDELPYPKDQIKLAILTMLNVTSDPHFQEQLKIAYVSLADWQAGVGPTHVGLAVKKLDRTKSPLDLAKDVGARVEEIKKWQPIVAAEQETLIGELRHFGFW